MKKALSMFLTLIMIMSITSLNVFADTAEKKEVTEVSITFDSDIAGKSAADFMEFFTVNTEGVEIRQDTFDAYPDTNEFNKKPAETFELGKGYHAKLYVYPKDGYTLPWYWEMLPLTLDAVAHDDSNEYTNVIYYMSYDIISSHIDYGDYIEISFSFRVTGPQPEPTGIAKLFQPLTDFFNMLATFFTETFLQPIADLFMKIG